VKNYTKQTEESEKLKEITCDVCKKTFDIKKDFMQIQEFSYIDFVGGYSSIFGDMNRVQCDICQDCLKKLLSDYLRINPSEGSIFYTN